MDACASALMWYLLGFGFAYGIGDNPNRFIGDALFGLARVKSHNTGSGTGRWLDFVFQWAFCATAVTIPAGSVAERCNFNAYLGYSTFISALVYPVVAHWVWCTEGWLGYGTKRPLWDCGLIDFAGSSVIHMLGGLSGLAGAVLLGPRMGRFDLDGKPLPLPGHSVPLVVLGTVLLWFGWYGFNPASTLYIDTAAAANVAGRAAVTTTLAGGAGGVACMVWTAFRTQAWDPVALCNGALCGFVAVTAGCHVLEPWAALLCGAGAGIIFDLGCILLLKLGVDDPLSAAPMHGFCGAWGTLFVGLLAKKEYLQESYSRTSYPYGLFYGGGGKLLGCQVVGVLAIAAWTVGLMAAFFAILKYFNLLRVSPEEELRGLDVSRHQSRAYYMEDGPTLIIDDRKVSAGAALGDRIMRGDTLGQAGFAASQPTFVKPAALSVSVSSKPAGGGGGAAAVAAPAAPSPGKGESRVRISDEVTSDTGTQMFVRSSKSIKLQGGGGGGAAAGRAAADTEMAALQRPAADGNNDVLCVISPPSVDSQAAPAQRRPGSSPSPTGVGVGRSGSGFGVGAPQRSASRNAVVPVPMTAAAAPGGGAVSGRWGSQAMSGAFNDAEDISVHRLEG
ncbi:hypothetical protein GPECTOR_20g564 [Gonium pectorale]|uniref:Ammonium transporter n=1 Tax=Gonium pectorale TaxID=33097 RepID=A0A150GIS6_GONPE|nr:hypothetical protein GPECTOR_20g564 [Gonium pectorale]|eukprot:KXZ49707.1 hypothetical protein GPECTOR_20g564 [Gonium pectorale]